MSVSDPSALLAHWNANVAPLRPSASATASVVAVSVSPTRASPVMAGAPVAAALPGPDTVAETAPESFRPSRVQIASAAAQSVVAASVSVISSSDDGRTRTATRRFSPRVTRFASTSRPFATSSAPASNAVSFRPRNSSLNTISKPNSFLPSCAAGTPSKLAVSAGSPSSSMVPVAAPPSSVAPDGFDSVSVKVSSSSSAVSTRTVSEVAPAAKVSVPDAAV